MRVLIEALVPLAAVWIAVGAVLITTKSRSIKRQSAVKEAEEKILAEYVAGDIDYTEYQERLSRIGRAKERQI